MLRRLEGRKLQLNSVESPTAKKNCVLCVASLISVNPPRFWLLSASVSPASNPLPLIALSSRFHQLKTLYQMQ